MRMALHLPPICAGWHPEYVLSGALWLCLLCNGFWKLCFAHHKHENNNLQQLAASTKSQKTNQPGRGQHSQKNIKKQSKWGGMWFKLQLTIVPSLPLTSGGAGWCPGAVLDVVLCHCSWGKNIKIKLKFSKIKTMCEHCALPPVTQAGTQNVLDDALMCHGFQKSKCKNDLCSGPDEHGSLKPLQKVKNPINLGSWCGAMLPKY